MPSKRFRNSTYVTPDNDAGLILEQGGITAVFSLTQISPHAIFRHLSVSVEEAKSLPAPELVFTLAYHFGFTGAQLDANGVAMSSPKDWQIMQDPVEGVCLLTQRISNLN